MRPRSIDILSRGKAWKNYVEQSLSRLSIENEALRDDLDGVKRQLAEQREYEDKLLSRSFHRKAIAPLAAQIPELAALGNDYTILARRRASQMLILFINPNSVQNRDIEGASQAELLNCFANGLIDEVALIVPRQDHGHIARRSEALLDAIETMPLDAMAWLKQRRPPLPVAASPDMPDYFAKLSAIIDDIDRLDFRAQATHSDESSESLPFDRPESLPKLSFAEPRRKSAIFLHNNYYHFNCLSAGLRKRGWDTVTVSLESPKSVQQQFFHGEDVNLFDPDPAEMHRRTRDFFRMIPERFGALHFYGAGAASFFSGRHEQGTQPQIIPWDFLELRRHGIIIGYTPSGCLDGGLQSSIHDIAGGLCDHCIWQLRPDICSDERNLVWNRKLNHICDWIGLEGDYATPERVGERSVYGPVVATLDPDRWHPQIEIPENLLVRRDPGEVLVYHAVGNYEARRQAGRDIKGTGAIMTAVERLQAEGLPVRLIFAHDLPSTSVRFLQVQADIVVDQLNYGRYGANAREALMLGKATICRLSPHQAAPLPALRPIREAPMVDATEDTIRDVLRALVLDPQRRMDLGRRARAFAFAWHGQDASAERYERIIDRIRAGLAPETTELYPSLAASRAWTF